MTHAQKLEAARFVRLESPMAPLPIDNIDTDQIVPARFLKTTSRQGLGDALFAGWRQNADGSAQQSFVLENGKYRNARILVAGDNFGCGSSREHAPWALLDYGFRAVVSTRFADIFRANALRNGLLPVTAPEAVHRRLMATAFEAPEALLGIDLEALTLTPPWGGVIAFEVEPFPRRCLLEGIDPLGFLMAKNIEIEAYETKHPKHFVTTNPVTAPSAASSKLEVGS